MDLGHTSSQSRLKMFNDCNHKHFRTYILDEDTPDPMDTALGHGTVLHLAMAEYGRASKAGLCNDLAKQAGLNQIYAAWFDTDRDDPVACFLATVEIIKAFEFLEIELQIMMDLGPHNYNLNGTLDAIVRDNQGRVHILDYKFLKSDNERYAFDIQACTYIALARSVGYHPVSFQFVQAIKSRLEIDQGESEHEYQARLLAACLKNASGKSSLKKREPEFRADYKTRVQAHYKKRPPSIWIVEPTEAQIEDCLDAHMSLLGGGGLMQGRNPESCRKYGRRCEFLNKCNGNMIEVI